MKKIIATLMLAPTLASAQVGYFETGNTLYEKMGSTSPVEKMVALGYVKGISDAHSGTSICPPSNITAGQINDMVFQFLRSYPEHRSYTGNAVVLYVLSSNWPCNNGSTM